MKIFNLLFGLFLLTSLLSSCDFEVGPSFKDSKQQTIATSEDLLRADYDFSKMSEERGMKRAFLHYMDQEAVLLRPDEEPIVGADAIEYLSRIDDSGLELKWTPERATVSADGTLGYTYGMYTVESGNKTLTYPYVKIWRKRNGEWKFILETYSQGY